VLLDRRVSRLAGAGLLAVALLAACTPVTVREGEVASADIGVPPGDSTGFNILAIGVADAQGSIAPRSTGLRVAPGSHTMIGAVGPGLVDGTTFAVIGLGPSVQLVRFTVAQTVTQGTLPAAVLWLNVPDDAPAGLYSLLALRDGQISIFTAGIEVG
jgi:hypothetical protein